MFRARTINVVVDPVCLLATVLPAVVVVGLNCDVVLQVERDHLAESVLQYITHAAGNEF